MPKWFEFKVTIGNVISLAGALIIAVAAYTTLSIKVDDVSEVVEAVPLIEKRVTMVEVKTDSNNKSIDKLVSEIEEQGRAQNSILQSLARIEERLAIPPR